MYTKLANSILTSTVWMESNETRIVWLTMLAMADKNGEIQASIPGLANVARVTVEQAEEAIRVFLAPDPYSRTKTDEGRRIEEIEGGWSLINHEKYRDLASDSDRKKKAADRQRRYRERVSRDVTRNARDVTRDAPSRQIPQADTDTDAKAFNTEDSLVAENPAPKPTPAEVVLTYPCSGKSKEWRLTESQLAEWQASYSGLDVLGECKKALQWLKANRLKTAGGMPRFLVSWLNRANDRPSGGNGRMLTPAQQREANMKASLDEAKRAAGLEQFQGMIRINHERKTDG